MLAKKQDGIYSRYYLHISSTLYLFCRVEFQVSFLAIKCGVIKFSLRFRMVCDILRGEERNIFFIQQTNKDSSYNMCFAEMYIYAHFTYLIEDYVVFPFNYHLAIVWHFFLIVWYFF